MKNPYVKWAVIILIVILVIVILYLVFKPSTQVQSPTNPPVPGPNPTANILGQLLNNIGPFLGKLFGKKNDLAAYCAAHPEDITQCNSTTDCYNGCRSSMPGYDCNGNLSSYC